MSGGGTNTVTQQSAPNPQFMQAYQNVNSQAQAAAAQPLQQYQGNIVQGLTPEQQQAIGGINAVASEATPYNQSAASEIAASTQPLLPTVQPYLTNSLGLDTAASQQNLAASVAPFEQLAGGGYNNAANINLGATLAPFSTAATQGFQNAAGTNFGAAVNPEIQQAGGIFGSAGSGITYNPVNASQISQYESPYTQQVVNATQAEFNNQNQQQQQSVAGNAIAQGAYGGDRSAVAAGITAGQEQLAQAPVIAGLENQGYSQALGEANTQQQTQLQQQIAAQQAALTGAQGITSLGGLGLSATQAGANAQLAGAQGIAGLGSENLAAGEGQGTLALQAAQGEAGLGSENLAASQAQANNLLQSGQAISGLGQTALGANEANAWLASQAGYGYSNLGNTTYNQDLGQENAELAAGGLEQQVGQEQLNVPYEQYLAQQAYPFQTTGWEANIAEGLGGASGGTSSTTSPGPSAISQAAGLGITGLALNGMGAFNGIGSGLSSLGGALGIGSGAAAGIADTGAFDVGDAAAGLLAIKRGGNVPTRATGGIVNFPSHLTRMPGTGHGGITANDNGIRGPHVPTVPRLKFADGSAVPDLPLAQVDEGSMPPDQGGITSFGGGDQSMPIPPIPPAQIPGSAGLPPPPPPVQQPSNGGITASATPSMAKGHEPSAPTDAAATGNRPPWEALLAAGLNIMGGTSPHALTNIGRGAMEGLQFGEQQRARQETQDLQKLQQQETAKYHSGELDLRGQQIQQTGDLSKAEMAQKATLEQSQQAQALQIAKMHIGMEGANLAETRRYHDQEAQQRSDALNLGKYTYQPVTQPDPNDPTKTVSGVLKLAARGDEQPQFIPTQTDPNKAGQAGISGRESVFFNRVAAAGNEAATAASNISELPLDTSTGWFGGRQQGSGLLSAAKESLTNTLTPQTVQDYNTMIAGVSRNLSTIESAGLAPSGSLTHSMDSIILKEGDTPLTQMRKLAEMRQVIEKGLEPNLANPRIPQQQRDVVTGIIKQIQGSIPFTQHDVTMFERQGKTGQTLADYASGNNLGGKASTMATPKAAAPVVPQMPTGAPPGSLYSPSRNAWRTPDGQIIPGSQ